MKHLVNFIKEEQETKYLDTISKIVDIVIYLFDYTYKNKDLGVKSWGREMITDEKICNTIKDKIEELKSYCNVKYEHIYPYNNTKFNTVVSRIYKYRNSRARKGIDYNDPFNTGKLVIIETDKTSEGIYNNGTTLNIYFYNLSNNSKPKNLLLSIYLSDKTKNGIEFSSFNSSDKYIEPTNYDKRFKGFIIDLNKELSTKFDNVQRIGWMNK